MRPIRRCNRLTSGASQFAAEPVVPSYIDTSLVAARGAMDDDAATCQMASDMREASHREGGMSREDLELLGYTPAQIERLSATARRRANLQAAMS